MNNYSVDEDYRNMLNSFQSIDLQTILGAFGLDQLALTTQHIITKIYEIYRSLPSNAWNNIMTRRLLQNQQQQQWQMISYMGQIQNPPQIMYQTPQYPQQSIHMARAGLPQ
ncbi:Uncharacterized protein FWK35_00013141, partial [Aphis craccivora]